MNEPEQQQSPNPSEEGATGAAPVPPSATPPAPAPEYGQYHRPAYGAMDNQFPADYDPYIFGRPDPTPQPAAEAPAAPVTQPMGAPWPAQPQQPNASGRPADAGQPQSGGKYPRYVNGIDMEDPNQNIFYGHWDFGAIIAFVFALFLPVPLLPAILGGVSMRRTRVMRMKGYGLALAAVIINVLYTIAFVYLMFNGISMDDAMNRMMDQMMQSLNGSSTPTQGGGDGSLSA